MSGEMAADVGGGGDAHGRGGGTEGRGCPWQGAAADGAGAQRFHSYRLW